MIFNGIIYNLHAIEDLRFTNKYIEMVAATCSLSCRKLTGSWKSWKKQILWKTNICLCFCSPKVLVLVVETGKGSSWMLLSRRILLRKGRIANGKMGSIYIGKETMRREWGKVETFIRMELSCMGSGGQGVRGNTWKEGGDIWASKVAQHTEQMQACKWRAGKYVCGNQWVYWESQRSKHAVLCTDLV